MRKYIIAGNWKMNKTKEDAIETVNELKKLVTGINGIDIVLGVPSVLISDLSNITKGSNIKIAAQNIYTKEMGAYTGEISAEMIKSVGATYVILGHSERREYFNETDKFINEKIKIALKHGLKPILCIGENLEERKSGKLELVIKTQISGSLSGLTKENMENIVIAYEPIWAIGTGETATSIQADEAHKIVRLEVSNIFGETVANSVRIQYGGSMKPANASELLSKENVDGGLIGGASLKALDFSQIIKCVK